MVTGSLFWTDTRISPYVWTWPTPPPSVLLEFLWVFAPSSMIPSSVQGSPRSRPDLRSLAKTQQVWLCLTRQHATLCSWSVSGGIARQTRLSSRRQTWHEANFMHLRGQPLVRRGPTSSRLSSPSCFLRGSNARFLYGVFCSWPASVHEKLCAASLIRASIPGSS